MMIFPLFQGVNHQIYIVIDMLLHKRMKSKKSFKNFWRQDLYIPTKELIHHQCKVVLTFIKHMEELSPHSSGRECKQISRIFQIIVTFSNRTRGKQLRCQGSCNHYQSQHKYGPTYPWILLWDFQNLVMNHPSWWFLVIFQKKLLFVSQLIHSLLP